jgi:hypothetical protein
MACLVAAAKLGCSIFEYLQVIVLVPLASDSSMLSLIFAVVYTINCLAMEISLLAP